MVMSISDPDDSLYLNGQIATLQHVLRRLVSKEALYPGLSRIAETAAQEFASDALYCDRAPEDWIIGTNHAEEDILKMIRELTGGS